MLKRLKAFYGNCSQPNGLVFVGNLGLHKGVFKPKNIGVGLKFSQLASLEF